jgi:dihydrofolate reductase
MARPQISVFAAVSLDGYLATTDDGLEWLQAAANPTDDHGFDELVDSVDAIAMGRRTWDHIADVPELPYRGRPIFVFTHQPPTAPRTGVTFWARTSEQAVVEWEALGYHRVYVDGGEVVSSFLAAGCVDDLTITVVPTLLGAGRPLFGPIERSTELLFLGATSYASGLVTLRYRSRT